ncbi:MAG: hypothetical protein ABIO67_06880 [Mycobacteriales bacterium]
MSRPRLRAVAGVALAGSLIVSGAVALAAGQPADACVAWTDPKGDATTGGEPTGAGADANLDIVSASVGSVDGKFRATISTAGLNAGPSDAGDEFGMDFTVGGADLFLAVDRDVDDSVSPHLGSYSDPTVFISTGVTGAFDIAAKTVTLTATVAAVDKAAGVSTGGKPVTGLLAYTANAIPFSGFAAAVYDSAAGKGDYSLGSDCGGSAAPAPSTASASASPTASASASPSASASAAPSSSPSASASPPAAGGTAAAGGLPVAGCVLSTDPKDDAHPLNANAPTDPDLDLLGLTYGTSDGSLRAFAKINKLAAGPASSTDGHRFSFYFTFNKHVFAMAGSAYKNTANASVKDGLASTGQFSKVTQLSVDGPGLTDPNSRTNPGFVASGLKFSFDLKNSYVIATLPVADIEKYGKAPFAGSTLTGLYVTSATDTDVVSSQADVLPDGAPTTKPSTLTYDAGDNHCFAPVVVTAASASATSLIVSAPSRVQTSDVQITSIRLAGSDGKPVAGGAVTARLGSGPTVSGKTNGSGTLSLRVPVTGPAAQRTLAVNYGTTTVRRATTVLAERSLLNYKVSGTGTTRQVTVTLTDDDSPTRHPYAGTTVTFAYSGKKVTATTDKAGQAIIRVKTGTKMDMTYAGKPGYITSALRQTTVG